MKKHLINSILAILFSIALVLSISCLTLLNDNFIIKVMDSNNYYSEVYKSIRVDKNYKCEVDKDKLIKDIKTYVKKGFNIDKVKVDNKCNDLYKEHISIDIFNKINMRTVYYGTFLITIVVVIIIGSLFIKTKGIHSLDNIILISFPLLIVISGIVYIFISTDIDIINKVINSANDLLLGISIILFEIIIFKKIKTRLKK